MNERIKTMWEESTGSMWPRPGKFTAGEYDTHLAKFAELIVKECIQELETSKKCDPYTGDLFDCEYNICINEQTAMLTEYFGVEE